MKHGKGRYTWFDSSWYEGDWVNGKMEGIGTMKLLKFLSYTGSWS